MTNVEILELNYNKIKNDFKNNNVDLYVALVELETISRELIKNIVYKKESAENEEQLLHSVHKLYDEVLHEIICREKEKYLTSNNI